MASLYLPSSRADYLAEPWRNARPVSGQYLTRNHHTPTQRAYDGAELALGIAVGWPLTIPQAASLVRSNPSAVGNAIRQMSNRSDVERGLMPLSRRNGNRHGNGHGKGNGKSGNGALPLDDVTVADVIADIVGKLGIERFKAIASAVVNVSL